MGVPTVGELDYIQSGAQAVWFAATFFILVYVGLNRRWWKNVWAQMIVSLDACLWMLDLPTCLRLWFHWNLGSDAFAWYDGTTVWLTALVILWRACMIIYIQFTRARRTERQRLEAGYGERPEREMAGPSAEHGTRWHDEPPTVRGTHPGGDGVGD